MTNCHSNNYFCSISYHYPPMCEFSLLKLLTLESKLLYYYKGPYVYVNLIGSYLRWTSKFVTKDSFDQWASIRKFFHPSACQYCIENWATYILFFNRWLIFKKINGYLLSSKSVIHTIAFSYNLILRQWTNKTLFRFLLIYFPKLRLHWTFSLLFNTFISLNGLC